MILEDATSIGLYLCKEDEAMMIVCREKLNFGSLATSNTTVTYILVKKYFRFATSGST